MCITSQDKYTSVTHPLIEKYERLRQGYKPSSSCGNFDYLMALMKSLHKVVECEPGDPRIVPNASNPCWLLCVVCKGFAMKGTCSHVACVTDLLMQARPIGQRDAACDVERMLKTTDENKGGKKKRRMKDLINVGATVANNQSKKALNKKTPSVRGKYSNKKSERENARKLAKAIEKKLQRDRSAAAKEILAARDGGKKSGESSQKKKPKSKKPGPSARAKAKGKAKTGGGKRRRRSTPQFTSLYPDSSDNVDSSDFEDSAIDPRDVSSPEPDSDNPAQPVFDADSSDDE